MERLRNLCVDFCFVLLGDEQQEQQAAPEAPEAQRALKEKCSHCDLSSCCSAEGVLFGICCVKDLRHRQLAWQAADH